MFLQKNYTRVETSPENRRDLEMIFMHRFVLKIARSMFFIRAPYTIECDETTEHSHETNQVTQLFS